MTYVLPNGMNNATLHAALVVALTEYGLVRDDMLRSLEGIDHATVEMTDDPTFMLAMSRLDTQARKLAQLVYDNRASVLAALDPNRSEK